MKNGNYEFTINLEDGTKIRTVEDNIVPRPEYPESIDLKITDRCDLECPMCHESSTNNGVHADYDFVHNLISTSETPEFAIGGGNPLTFPKINELLSIPNKILNMTVHSKHLDDYKKIIKTQPRALGISYSTSKYSEIVDFINEHPEVQVVIHLIAGYNTLNDLSKCIDLYKRILILGYKDYGRGMNHAPNKLLEWRKEFARFINRKNIIAFDNLAIDQLDLRRFFLKKDFDSLYMGDEGQFTMYVDAVKKEFAKSSTSQRKPANNLTLKEMFKCC